MFLTLKCVFCGSPASTAKGRVFQFPTKKRSVVVSESRRRKASALGPSAAAEGLRVTSRGGDPREGRSTLSPAGRGSAGQRLEW